MESKTQFVPTSVQTWLQLFPADFAVNHLPGSPAIVWPLIPFEGADTWLLNWFINDDSESPWCDDVDDGDVADDDDDVPCAGCL